jgi:hypothetical protein
MSAAKSRAIFDEDDDSDSIASDTTADSETAEEYSVEKILCDRRSDQGQILYLGTHNHHIHHFHSTADFDYIVKWEGYPLHRATWEPSKHFAFLYTYLIISNPLLRRELRLSRRHSKLASRKA